LGRHLVREPVVNASLDRRATSVGEYTFTSGWAGNRNVQATTSTLGNYTTTTVSTTPRVTLPGYRPVCTTIGC
jgi:hypothetical protein